MKRDNSEKSIVRTLPGPVAVSASPSETALLIFFVDEYDPYLAGGVKGVGMIGVVGVAAAIANAVFHATGRRMRDLPIRLEHLLDCPS
jgi:xanthine dehydrogenase YagR molybdenum-binding subunit